MYKILETLEAINDLTNLAIYIYHEFSNELAAERLINTYSYQLEILQDLPSAYYSTEFYYRNYLIRKCSCENINIFYIIDDRHKQIIILRVFHTLQNWHEELNSTSEYHISLKHPI